MCVTALTVMPGQSCVVRVSGRGGGRKALDTGLADVVLGAAI